MAEQKSRSGSNKKANASTFRFIGTRDYSEELEESVYGEDQNDFSVEISVDRRYLLLKEEPTWDR